MFDDEMRNGGGATGLVENHERMCERVPTEDGTDGREDEANGRDTLHSTASVTCLERAGAGAIDVAHVGTSGPGMAPAGWREIDRQLKRVAKARGGLDADELLWLARAERAEVHRQFGHATILEYVERTLGYGPRVAR
jgi:hypothetical protein